MKPHLVMIGDRYPAWLSFQARVALNNDSELQPLQGSPGKQPQLYYLPGGVWYSRRFYEAICNLKLDRDIYYPEILPIKDVAGYQDGDGRLIVRSSVSFAVDEYPISRHKESKERVLRIKSHYRYTSITREIAIQREKWKTSSEPRNLDEKKFYSIEKRHALKSCTDTEAELIKEESRFEHEAIEALKHKPNVVVIEDMDMGFRSIGKIDKFFDQLEAHHKAGYRPALIVHLGRTLPRVPGFRDKPKGERDNGLWERLACFPDQCIIIVNADLLRFTGANISRRISWERTARDCVLAFRANENLKYLAKFRNIVVRFGVTAAIFIAGEKARLFYDSKAHDGVFREVEDEGTLPGNNAIFGAHIARQLIFRRVKGIEKKKRNDKSSEGIPTAIGSAIPHALAACQKLYQQGFGNLAREIRVFRDLSSWAWPSSETLAPSIHSCTPADLTPFTPVHHDLVDYIDVPIMGSQNTGDIPEDWSIASCRLENSVSQKRLPWERVGRLRKPGSTKEKAFKTALLIARDIVFNGLEAGINHPKLSLLRCPLVRFGNLTVVDRSEIEGIRAAANVTRQYLASARAGQVSRPLSLAIFGPPGSGKSFTATELIASIDKDVARTKTEINVAQLSSKTELSSALLRVHEISVTGQIPYVLFDEFDSNLGGPLGWLKFFLAPMEDGIFLHPKEGVFSLKRAIFVFSGGTKTSYAGFCNQTGGEMVPNDEAANTLKLPDFLSRIRSHIDVKGVNPDGAVDFYKTMDVTNPSARNDFVNKFVIEPESYMHIIRRAIIMRQFLKVNGLVGGPIDTGKARIDGTLLNGILTATPFRFDNRSMRSLVEMCIKLHGRLELASLPPPHIVDSMIPRDILYDRLLELTDYSDRRNDNQALA